MFFITQCKKGRRRRLYDDGMMMMLMIALMSSLIALHERIKINGKIECSWRL
jgi:hypothetical protein